MEETGILPFNKFDFSLSLSLSLDTFSSTYYPRRRDDYAKESGKNNKNIGFTKKNAEEEDKNGHTRQKIEPHRHWKESVNSVCKLTPRLETVSTDYVELKENVEIGLGDPPSTDRVTEEGVEEIPRN